MKTFQIFFAFLFALAIGLTVSAFKQNSPVNAKTVIQENTVTRGAGQYRYIASTDVEEDLQLPEHWVAVGETPPSCSGSNEIPCYVNYTGSDFDSFLSGASLPDLMFIAAGKKAINE